MSLLDVIKNETAAESVRNPDIANVRKPDIQNVRKADIAGASAKPESTLADEMEPGEEEHAELARRCVVERKIESQNAARARARKREESEQRARAERERSDREHHEWRERQPMFCTLERVELGVLAEVAFDALWSFAHKADPARDSQISGTSDRYQYDCPACAAKNMFVLLEPEYDEVTTTLDARCLEGCAAPAIALAVRELVEARAREEAQRVDRARQEIEARAREADERRRAELARFCLSSLADSPAPSWAIDGILPLRGLSLLIGDAGSRKTMTVVYWGLVLASGVPFLGEHEVTRTRVLLVLAEGDRLDHVRRIRDIARGLGVDADALFREGWLSLAPENWDLRLDDPKSAAKLDEALELLDYGAVLLDNFSKVRTLTAGNENDSATVTIAMRKLEAIARGRCVVLLHHVSQGSSDPRGSTAIKANADAVLKLAAGSDSHAATITLTRGKARHASAFEAVRYRFSGLSPDPIVAELVDPARPRAEVKADPRRAEMLKLLITPRMKTDVYKAIKGRETTKVAIFAALVDEELVVEVEPGLWRAK